MVQVSPRMVMGTLSQVVESQADLVEASLVVVMGYSCQVVGAQAQVFCGGISSGAGPASVLNFRPHKP